LEGLVSLILVASKGSAHGSALVLIMIGFGAIGGGFVSFLGGVGGRFEEGSRSRKWFTVSGVLLLIVGVVLTVAGFASR
jgi:uncharacterized membrane protein HdeD (DUF308 family)